MSLLGLHYLQLSLNLIYSIISIVVFTSYAPIKSSDVLRNRLESFEHALSLLYKFIILTFLNESKNIANDKALAIHLLSLTPNRNDKTFFEKSLILFR